MSLTYYGRDANVRRYEGCSYIWITFITSHVSVMLIWLKYQPFEKWCKFNFFKKSKKPPISWYQRDANVRRYKGSSDVGTPLIPSHVSVTFIASEWDTFEYGVFHQNFQYYSRTTLTKCDWFSVTMNVTLTWEGMKVLWYPIDPHIFSR